MSKDDMEILSVPDDGECRLQVRLHRGHVLLCFGDKAFMFTPSTSKKVSRLLSRAAKQAERYLYSTDE